MANKKIDKDDEIRFLSKYRQLDVSNKILICLYVLIVLTILNMILPYLVVYIESNLNKVDVYSTSDFNTITGSGIPNLGKTSGKDVLFICSENYQECHEFINVVKKAQKQYGFKTYYLKADELNDEENRNMLIEFDNDEEFISSIMGQIPIVLVLSEDHLVEGWVGVSNYENYVDFLKKSEVID